MSSTDPAATTTDAGIPVASDEHSLPDMDLSDRWESVFDFVYLKTTRLVFTVLLSVPERDRVSIRVNR